MGTDSKTTDMRPEANTAPSLQHFSWFFPRNVYAAQTSTPIHSQGTQNNMSHGIPVVPLRAIPPTPEPATNNSTTKTAKAKKPKLPAKVSNPIPPNAEQAKKTPSSRRSKRNLDVDADKLFNLDLSKMPSPVCSCTGVERVCYKWGTGGWQSSCCTKSISVHPLPMSPVKRGARVTGRKMSTGAYLKLLLKLSAEGYDLSHPVDLKHHWAKHGTNKFVTIK